jgi:hypothetical protein
MKSKKWLLLFLVFLSSCQSTSFYPEEDKIPLQKNENYQKPQDVPYEKLEYENYSEVCTVNSILEKIEKKESFAMYLYTKTCGSCLRIKPLFMKYIIETKYVFSTVELNASGNSLEEIENGLGTLYPSYFGKNEYGWYPFSTPHFYFFLNGEMKNDAGKPEKDNNYSYFVSFMNRYVKEA